MTKPTNNLPDLESVIQNARTEAGSREQPQPGPSVITTLPMVTGQPRASASANRGQQPTIVDGRANTTLKHLTVIAILIILLLVGAVLVFLRMRQQQMEATKNIPNQAVSVQGTSTAALPVISLTPDSEKLIVTKDLVSKGSLYFASGNFFGGLKPNTLTANQTYSLPNASGIICLDSNNCGYATPAQLAAAMQTAVTTINNRNQTITIQGIPNQISVITDGNTITLSLPQDIAPTSSPQFGGLSLLGTGTQNGNLLCDASNNCDYASASTAIIQGGNTFGTNVVIGAADNYGVQFTTNGVMHMGISNTGVIYLGGNNADRLEVIAQIAGSTPLVFQGATDDGNTTTLAVAEPTANNIVTLPNASGTICLNTGNCAGSGGYGNVLQGGNTFNATMVLGTNDAYGFNLKTDNTNRITMSNTGDIALLGNTTLSSDVVLGSSNVNRVTFNGEITGGTPLVFQGATDDEFYTQFIVEDPTALRTILLPNDDGTICLSSGTGCPGGGGGDVLQGGNNFGATMVLGTNDNFGLTLKTNNIDRLVVTNSGAATFTGPLTVQGNTTLGTDSSSRVLLNGQILGGTPFVFQGSTDDGFTTQFIVEDPTAIRTILLPNDDGTICLSSGNCRGIGGNGDVLQGGNSFLATMVLGTNDNFDFNLKTNNTNRLTITNTGVITALNDFNVGGNTALSGTLQVTGDTTIGAGSSLKLVGGTSFPLSPTEGQVFYRSDSNQLYVYDGTRWQADRSTATYIVAASNSVNKEKADFVGDGTNDQNAINAAIDALPSTGGAVVLLDGTFNLTGTVAINKSNTTLQGQGNSTVLRRQFDETVSATTSGVITITSDAVQVIQVYVQGNKGTYTNTNNNGILVTSHGVLIDQTTVNNSAGRGIAYIGPSIRGANVTNNVVTGSTGDGIYFSNNLGGMISNNTVSSGSAAGINLVNVSGTNVINNAISNNADFGIRGGGSWVTVMGNLVRSNTAGGIATARRSNYSGNEVHENSTYGILVSGHESVTVTGNNISATTGRGIYISQTAGSYSRVISNNTISSNSAEGIYVQTGSRNDIISSNVLYDNGGSGSTSSININSGNGAGEQLINNNIIDTAGTGYAIIISGPNNYLSGNVYSGTGATTIQDNGIGTIWDNQMDANGNIATRGQAGIALNGTTTGYSLQNTGSFVQGGISTPAAPAVATQGTTGATSWSYAVTAYDGLGETLASTATTVTTGNAVLDGSNFNRITPTRVNGAVSYRIYRTAAGGTPSSTGYIGTVAGKATTVGVSTNFYLDDTGLTATGAAPVANTTGTGSFINLLQNGNQVCDISNNCGYATSSGGSGYIQNGTSVQTANFYIQSAAAGSIAAVIQGAVSQTANLQEWQDSNGAAQSWVTSSGVLRLLNGAAGSGTSLSGIQLVISNGNSSTPLIDLGADGTAARIVMRNTGGTIVTVFNGSGYLGINNASPANMLSINTPTTTDSLAQGLIATGAATNKGLVIQGAASQTANLQEWQTSNGTIVASINATGTVFSLKGTDSNVATFTTTGGSALIIEKANGVNVRGGVVRLVSGAQWFGNTDSMNDRVMMRLLSSPAAGTPVVTLGSLGSAKPNTIQLAVVASGSQTYNIQEWQNSVGTPLLSVTNQGNIAFGSATGQILGNEAATGGQLQLFGGQGTAGNGGALILSGGGSFTGIGGDVNIYGGTGGEPGDDGNINIGTVGAGTVVNISRNNAITNIAGTTNVGQRLNVGSSAITSGTTVARFENAGGTCDVTPDVVGGIICTSDERLKKNIVSYDDALSKVLGLNVVNYNYLHEAEGSGMHVGVLAQELEGIMPDLVVTDADGNKSVSYAGLTPYLAKALQQQQQQINALQAQVGGSESSELTGASLNVSGAANVGSITVVGNATIGGTLTVTGAATFNNTLTVNGHIITGNTSGVTTIGSEAGAGSGASVAIDGNDTSGTITITTGTGAGMGDLATIAFANAYGAAPRVTLTPDNLAAADLPYYTNSRTTASFKLSTSGVPDDATVYIFNYQIMQ